MQEGPSKQKIPVVVVESHQHVCEHIHGVLRRGKVFRPWTLVHYDAHPDLACPHGAVPAIACFRPNDRFRPANGALHRRDGADHDVEAETKDDGLSADDDTDTKNLYEFLDSTNSGIAEWILPLVLAGHLTHVHWIRPPRQPVELFPAGSHAYHVGAWSRCNKGTALSFMELPKDAVVMVDWDCPYYQDDDSVVPVEHLLLPQPLHLSVSDEYNKQTSAHAPYILDVCLDYFYCHNPFVTDIQELDQDVATAFCHAVYQAIPYVRYSSRNPDSRRRFGRELLGCLQSNVEQSAQDEAVDHFAVRYYHHEQRTPYVQDLLDSLERSKIDTPRLIDLMADALPHMCMPHGSDDGQQEECLLDRFERGLHCLDENSPMLISIARSSSDGFTPAAKVADLQTRVLELIHEHFCGCCSSPVNDNNECRLRVVYDYGAWEGSSL